MADRPGLYLCCMLAAQRKHEAREDYDGLIFKCAKCNQHVIKVGGAWRVATTAALEQAAQRVMALPDHPATCGVWLQQVCSCSFKTEVLYAIAAIGDDKE